MSARDKKTIFNEEEAIKFTQKLSSKAKEEDIDKIGKKLDFMNRGPVAKIWDKVLELWNKLKDPETPWHKKAMIIGGLTYLILPIDVVADFIPVVGLLDDVFVILFVLKQVLELTTSKIIETIRAPIDAKVKEKLNDLLNKAIQNSIRNTAITFLLATIGILFVIFKPFGESAAFCIAAVIFLGLMSYSIINTTRWLKNAWPWIKSVWRERSIKKGIISEVKRQYHALEVYEDILQKGSVFIQALDEIPGLEEIFDHYLRYFGKKLLIFAASITVYCLVIYWIVKPYLINQFGGLTTLELYFYPVVHIWKLISSNLS